MNDETREAVQQRALDALRQRRISEDLQLERLGESIAQRFSELVEPTRDEARNGWTPETLTAHLIESEIAAQQLIGRRGKPRPSHTKKYSPHRAWRRK